MKWKCYCGGTFVYLDISACDDHSRPAMQCTKCLLNDADKRMGPFVGDVRRWLPDIAIVLFVDRWTRG